MKRRKLTYELCESIARQFTRKVDFEKFDPSACGTSVKNGWINDWFNRKIKLANYWTYEKCKEYVYSEMSKYKTIREFYINNPSVYRYGLKYYREMVNEYWEKKNG